MTPTGSDTRPGTRLPGAVQLAREISEGTSTATAAVETAIERIEACDGAVNAVVQRRFDDARREAAEADVQRAKGLPLGPLHGVPITIKDQYDVTGLRTTLGLVSRRDVVSWDGPLVQRLRRSGAIIVGKTNVSQLLLVSESDNAVFGRTNNPWDASRTSGGSSGGEAAVVAYGGSALGLGGDLGGSIRGPAAFCGVTGLKPTGGRLTGMDTPPEPFGRQEAILAQPGPIARNVEDLVLAMGVLASPGQGAFDPRIPPVTWGDPPGDVSGVGIGWCDDNGVFSPSPAIRRAVREAARGVERQGARVVEVALPDGERTYELFLRLLGADRFRPTRSAIRGEPVAPLVRPIFLSAKLPSSVKRLLAGGLRATGRARTARLLGLRLPTTPADYFDLLYDRARLLLDLMTAWDAAGIDVLVLPACGLPAPSHGTTTDLVDAFSYMMLANLLGLPAGVVPVTSVGVGEETDRTVGRDPTDRLAASVERGSAGLPVAVQVIGRPWREDLVLATMSGIEADARSRGSAPGVPVDPR